MRYLSRGFAVGALRRGRAIEQFLGACEANGLAGMRWIEIRPVPVGYEVVVYEVEDVGSERFADLVGFPPVIPGDEEDFGRVVGVAGDEREALSMAAGHGARDDRWVNQGVAGDEYRDFVRAGRRSPSEPS